jgi:hypothetical protein
VVDAAAANVRLTMLLANTIVKQPTTTAHNLLTPDIIKSYITQALPTGTDFLACRVLAPVTQPATT